MLKAIAILLALGILVCGFGPAGAEEEAWEKVQEILMETKDTVVLDGIERAPLRAMEVAAPDYGDWMVRFMLADPEKLNPITSSDAGAGQVLENIFESLLNPEYDPPYKLRGWVAKDYPEISDDRLTYTFELRDGVYFSDGKSLTAEDVVFSMKVIHNPVVLAQHLRNYYAAVKDVQVQDGNKISFLCDQPYFRNDLILGGFNILPRHFYDPEGLMDPVEVADLIDGSWEKSPHKERVERFGEQFNQNFNRVADGVILDRRAVGLFQSNLQAGNITLLQGFIQR